MAMMISKFNKLIHNKTVWLVFAIFISIAFVGVYTGSKSSGALQREQAASQIEGKLWGEEISSQEFDTVYRDIYALTDLSYLLQTGRGIPDTENLASRLREQAWIRLATIKKAESMGLRVTDQQTIDAIRSFPAFANPQTGAFDKEMYDYIVLNILSQRYRITTKDFEDLIRRNVLVQKVAATAAQGALVTDDEIKKAFHLFNDKLTVDYVALPRSLAGSLVISDEEAKQYFAENAEQFRLPKKRIAHFVEFIVSDYTNAVQITDADLAQIYESNKQRYIIPETATNAVPAYRPLEDVKGEIFELVSADRSRRAAANAADAFVASLSAEGATFESEAEKSGLTIIANTPAFAATDRARGIDPTAPFAREAFALELSPTQYYSDPVVGREKIYVIALKKELPDFLPAFEVVQADVLIEAQFAAMETAYIEKVEAIHADIKAALKTGTSFADAASKYSLQLTQTEPFNISTPLEGDFSREIMGATISFEKGTLVDLINTADEFLLAYISKKELADEVATLPSMRDNLAAGIRQEKAARLAQAWQASLLEEAGFEDLKPAVDSTES
ncbi:MAG: SurA N-terminal domain-containing protein [Pontiella sp.]